MKKKSKRTLTPKLRFPEFRDDDAWQKLPVGKVLAVRDEKRAASKNVPLYSLTIENGVTEKTARYNREFLVTNSKKKYKVVKYDDLVYNPSNLRWGAINFSRVNHDVVVSPIYEVLYISQPDGNSAAYVQYALMRPEQIQLFIRMGQGTLIERIAVKIDDFIATSMPLPTPPEQQKIADCLSSLDGLIAAEGRMLEALRAHKKGLMQQLFPQPGQTQPRLRFPEFRDKGEWEVQSFKPLYDFKPNNNYSRDQLNYDEGTVKNIHYGDIHTRFSTHFHINAEEVPFVNVKALPNQLQLNPESLCRPGDVIFADASEDLADVGKCIEIVDVRDERVLSGSHTILARPRSKSIVVGFGGYLFKSCSARAGIEKEAQGTKVVQISPKRLAAIKVCYPSSKQEQRCITGCLTSLDTRIAAQTSKIDALKQHKRGLMQQLFPAPEEE